MVILYGKAGALSGTVQVLVEYVIEPMGFLKDFGA
jgi:hypothetical protein